MADLNQAIQYLSSGTFDPAEGLDIKWWEYYDRILLLNATAANGYRFFAVPEGQGGKDKADTNWQVANQMPESERMSVMYLCFYYIPLEIRTQAEYFKIINLFKTAYFFFNINNKSNVIEFPLAFAWNAHFPLEVTGAAAGDQLMSRSIFNGCYELPIHIPLAAKTTVNVQIVFSAATDADLDNDKIYLSLVGPKVSLK